MKRSKRKSNASPPGGPPAALRLWSLSGFLFGTLLIWCFLVPVDATSVFSGTAQPQNFLCLILCVCLASAVAWTDRGFRFPAWQWWLVALCLGWLITVSTLAGQENNPRTAWYGFWQCTSLAGFYLCGRRLLAGPRTRGVALQLLLTGCYALAVHGLVQLAIDFPTARAAYELEPETYLRGSGIDAPLGSSLRKRFEDRLYSPEPYATFALANSLAVVLSAGLVLALSQLFESFRPDSQIAAVGKSRSTSTSALPVKPLPASASSLLRRVSLALGAALMTLTWFLTRSRTAYLSLLMVFAVWGLLLIWNRRRAGMRMPFKLAAIACGLAGSLIAIGALWLMRNDPLVLREAAKSLFYRVEYWQATLAMIGEHPMGIGLGNFQSYYPRYMLPSASETIADPHNWFLDLAAAFSLPFACGVAIWIVRICTTNLNTVAAPTQTADAAKHENVNAVDLDGLLSGSLLWGAVVGGSLCLIASWALAGIDLFGVGISWGVAALLSMASSQRVDSRFLSSSLAIRMAALAIILCLLASGSWQASGIAGPLLVLLAGSLPLHVSGTQGSQRMTLLAALLPLAGLTCFVSESWMPTTRSAGLIQQSASASSLADQLKMAQAAVAADPLDSEARRYVAQLLVADATTAPAASFERKANQADAGLEEWLSRDATSPLNWQSAGDRLLDLAAHCRILGSDPIPWLRKSQACYAQASQRKPMAAVLHLQLATVLGLLQETSAAKKEEEIAQRLSLQTPHSDLKLEAQQIWFPPALQVSQAISLDQGPAQDSAWVPAEPVAEWIRSL